MAGYVWRISAGGSGNSEVKSLSPLPWLGPELWCSVFRRSSGKLKKKIERQRKRKRREWTQTLSPFLLIDPIPESSTDLEMGPEWFKNSKGKIISFIMET